MPRSDCNDELDRPCELSHHVWRWTPNTVIATVTIAGIVLLLILLAAQAFMSRRI